MAPVKPAMPTSVLPSAGNPKATTAPAPSPHAKPSAPAAWTAPPVRSRTQVTASLWEERTEAMVNPATPPTVRPPERAAPQMATASPPRTSTANRWRHLPGIWRRCADVTCVVDLACCIGETCVALDQAICLASGGNFVGGECTSSSCACPTDLDGNGETGFDIVVLLSAWGTPDGDVNGDGVTEFQDLIVLLSAFGDC